MTSGADKWSQFIAQLIERTQDKRVQWSPYKPKQTDGLVTIDVVYQAKYKDKALRLYETKLRTRTPDIAWLVNPPREEVVLKIVDEQQADLFRFPNSPSLRDLLNAVTYQVAGIDDFLKEILEQ